MTKRSPIQYFRTSPEIIRLAVMLYVRFSRSAMCLGIFLLGQAVAAVEPLRFPQAFPLRVGR